MGTFLVASLEEEFSSFFMSHLNKKKDLDHLKSESLQTSKFGKLITLKSP